MRASISPRFAAAKRYAQKIPHMKNKRRVVLRLFPKLYAAIGARG